MERRVKERLVGAAVLVAAAVILIPEMLSGPKRSDEVAAKRSGDEPFKTYMIDLNRSPGAPTATPIDERAPPPEPESPKIAQDEPPASAPDSESPAEEPSATPQASPESAQDEPAPSPRVVTEPQPQLAQPAPTQPTRQPSPPAARETPAPAPVASAPAVPTSRGWAVQLGSFANRATADRMAKEFSGSSGRTAFVMPVKSGANTLYRVRVGPFADRAAANDALADAKKRVANAAVVAHP